jgi:AcrR family transcriptional regulator
VISKGPALRKRPYFLGKRLALSNRKRTAIIATARAQLESNGFLRLTLDGLARETGVTRQTIHNLFGSKSGLLEALFDQLALDGGMHRMREVMQQTDAKAVLPAFVKVFTDFWSKDRLFIRRIHGIAAIDPEFGAAVEARNRRRQAAAARVVDRMTSRDGEKDVQKKAQRIAALYALTSFEFFDALAESCGNAKDAAETVLSLARKAVMPAC